MNRLLVAGSMAGLLALAACGGGGGGSSTAPLPKAGAGSTSSGSTTGTLAFTLVIPAAATATGTTRKPAYVSPATNSVAFQVGSGAAQVVTVAPGSAACPLVGTAYQCTANANVAAGSGQHLTVTTYASTNGTGAALSANTLVVNILANQSNPVAVTLNGVAAAFALNALPASVTVGTPSSIVVTWSALDASGDTIVGPGSIVNAAGAVVAPSLATTNTAAFTIGAPSGNTWTVAYNGAAAASPVTFTVSNTGVTSANTLAAVNAPAGPLLFVANVTAGANTVDVFSPPYTTGTATLVPDVTTTNMAELAVNASGQLFIPNSTGVQIYAAPYTSAPATTIAIGGGTNQVALDSAGDLFAANANNTITEYAAPYTGAATATITNGLSTPQTMAIDSVGDLFVQNQGGQNILIYTPPYTGAPTVLSGPCTVPDPLCFEPLGEQILAVPGTRTMVSANDGYAVLTSAYPWTTTTYDGPFPTTTATYGAWGLAFDSANDLFVSYANSSANDVEEYAPPYTGAPIATISNGVSQPRDIAIDSSNDLYVTNINGTVTEYAPPYTGAPINTLTTGTAGAYPYDVRLGP